jgi:hypothetical protein
LSISEPRRNATEFDGWISAEFAAHGAFTALVILVDIDAMRVTPLTSTFFHVVGDETDWGEISLLFDGSGADWNGASFFPVRTRGGALLDNPTARQALQGLMARLDEDRLVLNEGRFFDKWGRQLRVEEIPRQ